MDGNATLNRAYGSTPGEPPQPLAPIGTTLLNGHPYVPAVKTNIRDTFARVRAELAAKTPE